MPMRMHRWIDSHAGTICQDCFLPMWAQHGECQGNPETDAMRAEIERLRQENADLQAKAKQPPALTKGKK